MNQLTTQQLIGITFIGYESIHMSLLALSSGLLHVDNNYIFNIKLLESKNFTVIKVVLSVFTCNYNRSIKALTHPT